MEMVPPAIYSLPQFGFSGSLTAHPGNNYLRMLWLLSVWSSQTVAPDFNTELCVVAF